MKGLTTILCLLVCSRYVIVETALEKPDWEDVHRWYWSFDGLSPNESSSVMSTDINTLLSADPLLTTGKKRMAFTVDATHVYEIDIGTSCIYDNSCEDGYTISFWLYIPSGSFTGMQTIMSTGADDSDGQGIHVMWDRDTDEIVVFVAEQFREFPGIREPLSKGTWTHIGIIVDPYMPGIEFFKSGSYVYTTNVDDSGNVGGWTDNNVPYGKLRIGQGHTGIGHFGDTNFKIDELHIWETPATAKQMTTLRENSGAASTKQIRVDFNYVYENQIVFGEFMAPVVSGNVTPILGRYGAGMEFLENSTMHLGYHGNCIEYPPAIPDDDSWCQVGFTMAFWLKLSNNPLSTFDQIVLGNTNQDDWDSGFIVTALAGVCTIRFMYRNQEHSNWKDMLCNWNQWKYYMVAYHNTLGGFFTEKTELESENIGDPVTNMLYMNTNTTETFYNFDIPKPFYVGHPTQGAHFYIDELYLYGSLVHPLDVDKIIDHSSTELLLEEGNGISSDFSPCVANTTDPVTYPLDVRFFRCHGTATCAARSTFRVNAQYFNGIDISINNGPNSTATEGGVIEKNTYGSEYCGFDTECYRGFSFRLWVYQADTKGSVDTAWYIDTGGVNGTTWGLSVYYDNDYLHFVVSTRRHEWRATVPFGFGQWITFNIDWWPYIGFRLHMADILVGTFTSKTRRNNPQEKELEASTDLYFARPAFYDGNLQDHLRQMYLAMFYYLDSTSTKLGHGINLRLDTYMSVWSPNNTLDNLAPDGIWLNDSLPMKLIGGATQKWRNSYFSYSVKLSGSTQLLKSDDLIWQCASAVDRCGTRSFMLSFWLKPYNMLANEEKKTIVWLGTQNITHMTAYYENNQTYFVHWLKGKRCVASVNIPDNSWTWVIFYWETTSWGGNPGGKRFVYLNSTKYNMGYSCDVSKTRPTISSMAGHLMFGAEPASALPDDYKSFMEMEVDDIRLADTYGLSKNWFDDYVHLYNVTPPELYSADTCMTYMELGEFPSDMPRLKIAPYSSSLFNAKCRFLPDMGITETEMYVYQAGLAHSIASIDPVGRFPSFNGRYSVDQTGIDTIKDQSTKCRQFLRFSCGDNGTTLFRTPTSSYWKDITGTKRYYWGGSNDENLGKCGCSLTDECRTFGSHCNCDGQLSSGEDSGYLRRKDRLPVQSLGIEYVVHQGGSWGIGPLICQNIDPDGMKWSFDDLNITEVEMFRDGFVDWNTTLSPILRQGVRQNAIQFNEDTGYVFFTSYQHQCLIDMDQCWRGISGCAWMRMGTGSGRAVIISSMSRLGGNSLGIELSVLNSVVTMEVAHGANTWKIEAPITTGVWTHVCGTWKSSYGTKLFINGADVREAGVTETVTNTNNPAGIIQPDKMTVGSDPSGTDGREEICLDEMWISPFFTYTQEFVDVRVVLYDKTYNASFESLIPPSDIFNTTDFIFDVVGNVKEGEGIIGNAFYLPTSGFGYIKKTLHYECLGKLDLCKMGFTFLSWMRINESVFFNETEFTVINAMSSTQNEQGFRISVIGNTARADMFLSETQELISQTFPVPIEKWFHFGFRWSNNQTSPVININGLNITNFTSTAVLSVNVSIGVPVTTEFAFGWSPLTPNIHTPMDVDEWFFAEREDIYDDDFILNKNYVYNRTYRFPFDSLLYPGDLLIGYEDLVSSPDALSIYGKVGRAVYIRGSTFAKVKVPFMFECLGQPTRCIRHEFSFYMWVYVRPTFSSGYILSGHSESGQHGFYIKYDEKDNGLLNTTVVIMDEPNEWFRDFEMIPRQWTFIAVSYKRDDTLKNNIWIDGQLIGNFTNSGRIISQNEQDVYLAFGANLGSGNATNFTDMAVDDFVFSETILVNEINRTEVDDIYALGSSTYDDFYWPLNKSSNGTLGSNVFPVKGQFVSHSAQIVGDGADFDGSTQYINLGFEPGTCLTQLEFCQTLNLFFFFSFYGSYKYDQYIISRTSAISNKSGFFLRYANLDSYLPLRRYFEVLVRHQGLLWKEAFHMEHNIHVQVHLQWALSGFELWLDNVLAVSIQNPNTTYVNEKTEESDLVVGKAFDNSTEYAEMSVDEIYIWDDINPPSPYLNNDYYHIGCYNGAAFPANGFVGTMASLTCRRYCGYEYRYVGISTANRCNCFHHLDDLAQTTLASCDSVCPATTDLCGSSTSTYRFSVYRTTAHLPFPDIYPISNCTVHINGHYEEFGLDAVDVNRTFNLHVTCETGNLMHYNYTMGDGTPFWYTLSNTTDFNYTELGTFNGWVELRNENNTVFVNFSVMVILPTEAITNLTVDVTNLEVNTVTLINTTMISGTRLNCTLDYGEGNSLIFSSVEALPLVSSNNTYSAVGEYNVTVTCENVLSVETNTMTIIIQERLRGFNITDYWLFEVDENKKIFWNYETGGDLIYSAVLGGINLIIDSLDLNHTLGINFTQVGLYEGWINVENQVSEPVNETFVVEVTRQIAGLNLQCPTYAATGLEFSVSVSVMSGSNADLSVLFPEPMFQSRFIAGDFQNFTYLFNGSFTMWGQHMIIVNSSNVLVPSHTQDANASCYVLVENSVGELNVTAAESIIYGEPLNVTLYLIDMDIPATNVDVLVTIQREGSPAHTCLNASFANFTITFMYCPFNVSAWYNISAVVKNNVSIMYDEILVPVGEPLTELLYEILTPFINVNQIGKIRVKAESRYGATVQITFGDGFVSPIIDVHGWTLIEHNYTTYGDFIVNITGSTPINSITKSCPLCIIVMEKLSYIQLDNTTLYVYGRPILKTWSLDYGSHQSYEILLDGSSSGIEAIISTGGKGSFNITDISKLNIGYHTLDIKVWNNISGPLNDSQKILVVKPVVGLSLTLSDIHVPANTSVSITSFYATGSMVNLSIMDVSGDILYENYYYDSESVNLNLPITFPEPGVFTLIANATNPLGSTVTVGQVLNVYNPINSCTVSVTSSDKYQDPVEVNININPNSLVATGYTITCLMGNGLTVTEALFTLIDPKTEKMNYTYTLDGRYTVACEVKNGISACDDLSHTQVGIPLGTLNGTLSHTVLELSNGLEILANMTAGSNMQAVFKFGDGNEISTSIDAGVEKSITYTFSRPGEYQLLVEVTNVFGKTNFTYPDIVYVQEAIDESQVILTHDRAIYPVGSAIHVSWNIPVGSNITADIVVQNSTLFNGSNIIQSSNVSIPSSFTESAGYILLSMKLENLVTPNFTKSVFIQVEKPLRELSCVPQGEIWQIKVPIRFDATLTEGSNPSFKISYDDGHPENTGIFNLTAGSENHVFSANRRFNNAGDYDIVCEVVNPLGLLNKSVSIKVQVPIYNADLQISKSINNLKEIHLTLYINIGKIEASHMKMFVDLGDGVTLTKDSFIKESPTTWTADYVYDEIGIYDISGRVFNNISEWQEQMNVTVGDPVKGLNFWAVNDTAQPGQSVDVCFNITKGTNASIFTFVANGETRVKTGYLMPYLTNCESFLFPVGIWEITCISNNSINEQTAVVNIYVENPVSGLYIQMPEAVTKGTEVQIDIGYTNLGVDYCVLVDIVGTNDSYHFVFGVSHCEADHEGYEYRIQRPDLETLQLTKTFEITGVREVTSYAYNRINSQTVMENIAIVQCQLPKVTINGLGKKKKLPVQFYRAQAIRIEANIINSCTVPWNMTMKWTLEYWPNRDKTLAQSINTTQPNLPVLKLPERALMYGYYHVNFFVKVGPYEGIQDEDNKYLNIIASPLIVRVTGRFSRVVNKGETVILNARDGSYDPDDPNNILSPLRYRWFVQKAGETNWVGISAGNRNYIRRKKRTLSDLDNGVLIVSKTLSAGEYRFKVVITKDSRTAYYVQTINIVAGTILRVDMKCLINCEQKTTTTNPISFKGFCLTCGDMEIQQEWTLYEIIGDLSVEVAIFGKTTTSLTSENFGLKSKALLPGKKYSLRYTVISTTAYGYIEDSFITNLPPYGGTCEVIPRRGVAMLTKYTVSCKKWLDEGLDLKRDYNADVLRQTELQYQFFMRPEGLDEPYEMFHFGSDSVTPESYIAMGYKHFGYHTHILIRVLDAYGESTDFEILDTVVAEFYLSYKEINEKISGKVNEFQFHVAAKDIRSLTASVLAYTEQLDRRGENECEGSVIKESSEDNKKRIKARTDLIKILSEARMLATTPESLVEGAGALKALTSAYEELTDNSMITAAGLMTYMSETLVNISTGNGFELMHQASEALFGAGGNLLDASQPESVTLVYQKDFELPEDEAIVARELARKEAIIQQGIHRNLTRTVVHDILNGIDLIRAANLKDRLQDETAIVYTAQEKVLRLQRHFPHTVWNKNMKEEHLSIQLPGQSSDLLANYSEEFVDSQAMVSANVFTWDSSAEMVKTKICGLKFLDSSEQEVEVTNLQGTVEIRLTPTAVTESLPTVVDITDVEKRDTDLIQHNVTFSDPVSGIKITIEPQSNRDMYQIYIALDYAASDSKYDETYILSSTNNYEYMIPIPTDISSGTYYISVKQVTRRANLKIYYALKATMYSCIYWNKNQEKWTGDGCHINMQQTTDLSCSCNHLTFFGADYVIAPNTIDFNTVFGKFATIGDNLAVFCSVLGLLVTYWLGILVLRQFDKKDQEKWLVRPLLDNSPQDKYEYVLTIITGSKAWAGTKSQISFIIVGTEGDSDIRLLDDGHRKVMSKGSVNHFILTTPRPLGDLTFIRIWHDNSGKGRNSSWYLQDIVLHDIRTQERHYFVCDSWLAKDKGDFSVEKLVPRTTSQEEIAPFTRQFMFSSRRQMRDQHLWLSVFSRPNRSTFTRVQRWSCCVSLLFLSMITSAMWYGRLDEEDAGQMVKIGAFRYSTKELFIATMTALICLPVSVLVIQLFRKTKRPEDAALLQAKTIFKDKKESEIKPDSKQSTFDSAETGMVTPSSVKLYKAPRPYDEYLRELESSPENKSKAEEITFDSEANKKQCNWSEFKLPYQCIIIGWILCWLSILASAFFVILYSLEWGKDRSEAWLSANCLGFLEDIFLFQPLKVLAVAAVLALIFKDPMDGEEIMLMNENHVPGDEFSLETRAIRSKGKDAVCNGAPVDLDRIKKQILKENKMDRSIQQILTYSIYILIVTLITYGQRDPTAYFVTKHIEDIFVNPSNGLQNFKNVIKLQQYENWANDVLLPGLSPLKDYNGDILNDWKERKLYALDGVYFRVGKTRLRQIRVKTGECETWSGIENLLEKECYNEYSKGKEERDSFTAGWKESLGNNNTGLSDPWIYHTAEDLQTVAVWGQMNTYNGGGYILIHPRSLKDAQIYQSKEFKNKWLDRKSRAVSAEFVLYNAHANLFSCVTFLMEMSSSGAINTWWDINILGLYPYAGNFGLIRALCEFMFLLFLVYEIAIFIKSVIKVGRKHFVGVWKILDFTLLVASIIAVAIYVTRYFFVRNLMRKFSDNKYDRLEFFRLGYFDRVVTTFIALHLFCSTLRMLQLLKLNHRVMILMRVLNKSASSLIDFSVVFVILMVAFASCAFGIFGSTLSSYANFIRAAESLLAAFVGARMFASLETETSALGRLFFLVYVCVMLFIMTNLLIAILNDAMEEVNTELADEIMRAEFINFIGSRLRDLIGIDSLPQVSINTGIEEKSTRDMGLQCGVDLDCDNEKYALADDKAVLKKI